MIRLVSKCLISPLPHHRSVTKTESFVDYVQHQRTKQQRMYRRTMKRFGPWWQRSRLPPPPHHHHRALSSSSSSTAIPPPPASAGAAAPVGRKRHRFFNNADDNAKVPTFRDFQLRFQLRGLYRKYWRLAKRNDDLKRQIRAEFHRGDQRNKDNINNQTTTTMILDERAISEGNRRYKELQSVLQAAAAPSTTATSSIPTKEWPWNKARHTKPEVFPPKSL
jgi:hypothetical protein